MEYLDEKECRVLACTHFDAYMPTAKIARKVRMRDHVVRRILQRLRSDGTVRISPQSNPFAMGLSEYVCWLRLSSPGEAQRLRLRRALCESDRTTYVSTVGGEYQFFCMFLCRKNNEIEEFFESIQRKSNVNFERIVGLVNRCTMFSPKPLVIDGFDASHVSYGPVESVHEIDLLDHKIMAEFARSGGEADAAMARKLGIPATTLDYRLKSLRARGIIVTVGHVMPFFRSGLTPFGLLLRVVKHSKSDRDKFFEYCRTHPSINDLIDVTGPWDHQIGVEVRDAREISTLVQNIQEAFREYIGAVTLVPMAELDKLLTYPFTEMP